MVLGSFAFRLGARYDGVRVYQVGRAVSLAANFTGIAILVFGMAVGALPLDIAIRQEHGLHRIIELLNRALGDQAFGIEPSVDVFAEGLVLGGIRSVVIVELDMETMEVA